MRGYSKFAFIDQKIHKLLGLPQVRCGSKIASAFAATARSPCTEQIFVTALVLAEFGASKSFGAANAMVKEHYDLDIGSSAVRSVTLQHVRPAEPCAQTRYGVAPVRALLAEGARTLFFEAGSSFLRLVRSELPRKRNRPHD